MRGWWERGRRWKGGRHLAGNQAKPREALEARATLQLRARILIPNARALSHPRALLPIVERRGRRPRAGLILASIGPRKAPPSSLYYRGRGHGCAGIPETGPTIAYDSWGQVRRSRGSSPSLLPLTPRPPAISLGPCQPGPLHAGPAISPINAEARL
jgi:hypothetical protein